MTLKIILNNFEAQDSSEITQHENVWYNFTVVFSSKPFDERSDEIHADVIFLLHIDKNFMLHIIYIAHICYYLIYCWLYYSNIYIRIRFWHNNLVIITYAPFFSL